MDLEAALYCVFYLNLTHLCFIYVQRNLAVLSDVRKFMLLVISSSNLTIGGKTFIFLL